MARHVQNRDDPVPELVAAVNAAFVALGFPDYAENVDATEADIRTVLETKDFDCFDLLIGRLVTTIVFMKMGWCSICADKHTCKKS